MTSEKLTTILKRVNGLIRVMFRHAAIPGIDSLISVQCDRSEHEMGRLQFAMGQAAMMFAESVEIHMSRRLWKAREN
jgi:hypothetical protein